MKLLTQLLTLAGQLLLSACVHSLPAGSADAEAIRDVEHAWRAAGLPALGDCLQRIEVRRHDTRESYVDACDGNRPGLYAPAAESSAGCLTTAMRGPLGAQVGVIEIAPGYHDDMTLVQHEALHRASWCAWGDVDAWHSRAEVWSAAGGADSVQARAAPPN